jgi:hypothetical protein
MAVAMRERWTDERLDDLKGSVDDGFKRVDQQFARVDQRFAQVDQRFAQVDQRFAHMESRFDGLQRTMTQGFIAMVGVQVTLFLGTLAFIAAH